MMGEMSFISSFFWGGTHLSCAEGPSIPSFRCMNSNVLQKKTLLISRSTNDLMVTPSDILWVTLASVTFWTVRENKVCSVPGLHWYHLLLFRQVMGKAPVNPIWHGVAKRATQSRGKDVEYHALDAVPIPKNWRLQHRTKSSLHKLCLLCP